MASSPLDFEKDIRELEEQIDLISPEPGVYAVLVHGFDTDPAGGQGAYYTLHAWSLGNDDYVGNLDATNFIADDTTVLVECDFGNGSVTNVPISWVRTEGSGRVFFSNFAKVDSDANPKVSSRFEMRFSTV